MMALEHPPYSPDFKKRSERSTKEVTAKGTRTLTEVSKNSFQKCFQKLYKYLKNDVTAQGYY
jgi:hypothetical protein